MTNMKLNFLNLGTYKMGTLELPATETEINEFFANLNPTDQDCELQWVETDLNDSHLDRLSLNQLQEIAEMDEADAETFVKILEVTSDFDEAKEVFENGEFTIYDECQTMADVAYSWIHDHVGSIEDAVSKERQSFYIDADQIKTDLECDSYFAEIEEEQGEELSEDERENMVDEMIEEGMFSASNYFDYEAFGRDMEIEGNFTYLGNSEYIQVWN